LDADPYNLFEITHLDKNEQQIIFIDEVQYLTNPSNFLKLIYDMFNENIKLVVSGSSSFYIDKKFKDSLMGRKKMYEIFTLDFEEFLDFKEEQSWKKILFEDKKIPILTSQKLEIQTLFLEYITFGGYPEVVLMNNKDEKIQKLQSLASDYIKRDIYDSNIEESAKFFDLLRILADQTGNLVNKNDL
jgi:predicted AAA+ superfamily ATPase